MALRLRKEVHHFGLLYSAQISINGNTIRHHFEFETDKQKKNHSTMCSCAFIGNRVNLKKLVKYIAATAVSRIMYATRMSSVQCKIYEKARCLCLSTLQQVLIFSTISYLLRLCEIYTPNILVIFILLRYQQLLLLVFQYKM